MKRRDRLALYVFGAAVAVRLLYFATTKSPSFHDPLIDGDYYDYLGLRIATGEGFEAGPFWQPPLYPLILGALYRVLGHDLLWPRLLQACLDGLTAVLVMRTTTSVTRSAAYGIAAGIAIALHGPMLFYSGEILPTSAASFAGMLAVYLAIRHGSQRRRWAGCGASIGAGALLAAPMLALIVPLSWLLGRKRWQRGAIAAGACVLVVICATWANWARSGEFVPISANAGINLYIGNHPDTDRLVAIRPGAAWEDLANEPVRAGVESLGAQDAWFVRRALAVCTSDAVACVSRLAGKVEQMLWSREIPRNENLDVVKADAWVLAALVPSVGSAVFPSVVLVPLGIAGLAVALRDRKRAARIVALSTLWLALPPILFFVTGRYRVVLVPELVVMAALGAHALRREWRRRGAEAAAAAIALGLAVRSVHLPLDDVPFEAEMYYAVGGRHARLGDDGGAVEAWRHALRLRPDYLEAGFNLGLAFERSGQRDDAIATYRRVLAFHPDSREALERLRTLGAL